jgi:hypothetical protein
MRISTSLPDSDWREVAEAARFPVGLRNSYMSGQFLRDMSVAGLWRESWCEAGELSTQVYGWFTEGFDTLDLKDAKKLARRCRQ